MRTVSLAWTDPKKQFTGVSIEMLVVGDPSGTFTPLTTIAPGVQKADIENLENGDYQFRAVAVNANSVGTARDPSPPVVTVHIADDATTQPTTTAPSVPDSVTGLTFTLSAAS